MAIGYSKDPFTDIQMTGGQNGQSAGPSRLTPQQAVKILSLRVPRHMPASAPINSMLLNAPGGSAPGASGLQSMIQQLMQLFQPQRTPAGAPPVSAIDGGLRLGETRGPDFGQVIAPPLFAEPARSAPSGGVSAQGDVPQTPAAPATGSAPPPPRFTPADPTDGLVTKAEAPPAPMSLSEAPPLDLQIFPMSRRLRDFGSFRD